MHISSKEEQNHHSHQGKSISAYVAEVNSGKLYQSDSNNRNINENSNRSLSNDNFNKKNTVENNNSAAEFDDDNDDNESNNLDLDTRIAMLLQNKDTSMAPPFLTIGLGSEDEEEENGIKEKPEEQEASNTEGVNNHQEEKTECDTSKEEVSQKKETVNESESGSSSSSGTSVSEDEGDDDGSLSGSSTERSSSREEGDLKKEDEPLLSDPPSPFISKEQYEYWYGKSLELKKEAQRQEQKENRERLKKFRKRKLKKIKKTKKKNEEGINNTNNENVAINNNNGNLQHKDAHMNGVEDDDRMSLSSLSSGEDPILHQQDIANMASRFQHPPISGSQYNAPHIPPAPPPGQYNPAAPGQPPFNAQPGSTGAHYNAPPPGYPQPHHQYPHPAGYPTPYAPPGYPMQHDPSYPWHRPPPGYPSQAQIPGYPHYAGSYMNYPQSNVPPGYPPMNHQGALPPYSPYYPNNYPQIGHSDDPNSFTSSQYHDPTINSVLDKVIDELKTILKMDFQKRMIEGTAFKTFETWWDDQERLYKDRVKTTTGTAIKPSDKVGGISALFEARESASTGTNYSNLDSLCSLGLGFRAAMPKMPSFKKIHKIKPPTPPTFEDEDSQDAGAPKEDSEDEKQHVSGRRGGVVVSGSDSEDLTKPSIDNSKKKSKVSRRRPGATWSSEESEEEPSSASSEEEKDESSAESSTEEESSVLSSDEDRVEDVQSSLTSDSEKELQKKKQSSNDQPISAVPSDDENEEMKELKMLDQKISEILYYASMKTPEREDREPTPLPEMSDEEAFNDSWMSYNPPQKEDSHIQGSETEAVVEANNKERAQNEDSIEKVSSATTPAICTENKKLYQSPKKEVISIASYLQMSANETKKQKKIKKSSINVEDSDSSSEVSFLLIKWFIYIIISKF